MRCGELCKSCVGKCREIVSADQPAEIECPVCDGDGGFKHGDDWIPCDECRNGYFELTECPSRFIGSELIQDIQIVSSSEHHLPVSGGLIDQSAWWFSLKELLKREENLVQSEQAKRRN